LNELTVVAGVSTAIELLCLLRPCLD
jgi:hypothetical protein